MVDNDVYELLWQSALSSYAAHRALVDTVRLEVDTYSQGQITSHAKGRLHTQGYVMLATCLYRPA